MLEGNTRENARPDQKDIFLDFKKDKTFVMTIGGNKKTDTGSGVWKYDASKKVVNLIIRGTPSFTVTSITESELIMNFGLKLDPSGQTLKVVYKVKTS